MKRVFFGDVNRLAEFFTRRFLRWTPFLWALGVFLLAALLSGGVTGSTNGVWNCLLPYEVALDRMGIPICCGVLFFLLGLLMVVCVYRDFIQTRGQDALLLLPCGRGRVFTALWWAGIIQVLLFWAVTAGALCLYYPLYVSRCTAVAEEYMRMSSVTLPFDVARSNGLLLAVRRCGLFRVLLPPTLGEGGWSLLFALLIGAAPMAALSARNSAAGLFEGIGLCLCTSAALFGQTYFISQGVPDNLTFRLAYLLFLLGAFIFRLRKGWPKTQSVPLSPRCLTLPLCFLLPALLLCGLMLGLDSRKEAGLYALGEIGGDPSQITALSLSLTESDAVQDVELVLEKGQITPKYSPVNLFSHQSHDYKSVSLEPVPLEGESQYREFVEYRDVYYTDGRREKEPSYMLERTQPGARMLLTASAGSHGGKWWQRSLYQSVYALTDIVMQTPEDPFRFIYEAVTDPKAPGATAYYYQNNVETPKAYVPASINEPLYCELGGVTYVTPPLCPAFSGTSAIYRVNEWRESGYSVDAVYTDGYMLGYSLPPEQGDMTAVAKIPIEGEYETVLLTGAEGKLYLFLIEDGMLTLRAYTPEGELLLHTPLFPYQSAAEGRITMGAEGESYEQYLQRYTIDLLTVEDTLCCRLTRLVSASWDEGENRLDTRNDATLFALSLSTGEMLSRLEGDQASPSGFGFTNGRWVTLEKGEERFFTGYASPLKSTLRVLDKEGRELASAEILTDGWEDYIQYYHYNSAYPSGLRFGPARYVLADMKTLKFAE